MIIHKGIDYPTLAVEILLLTIISFAALPLLRDLLLADKVQWDRSPDFTSGTNGQADGHAFVDATQTLCSTCVESFSLGNLTLRIDGSTDFFGRLNAGNRILVSRLLTETPTESCSLLMRRAVFSRGPAANTIKVGEFAG